MHVRCRRVFSLIFIIMLAMTVAAGSTVARERPSPRISLSVFACPPGMTEQTLATVDCAPVTDGFDVSIVSIDGTQATIHVADGQQDGHVVRWQVTPSNAEVDNWGLRQTAVPAGTIAYLLQGESVEYRPSSVYDYRFQTTESAAQTDLSMYLFSSASQGVIIPPSDAGTADTGTAAEQDEESAPSEEPVETPEPAPATTPAASSGAPEATSTQTPVATETVTQDNVAIRLAADLSAVIIDTVSAGEVVDILGDPIEAGNQLWYQVVSNTNARGWIQSFAFDAVAAAPASTGGSQSADISSDSATASASTGAPDLQPGDRATVNDPPLNLRQAPGSGAEVVATLDEGQMLRIDAAAGTEGGHVWYAVTLLPEGVVSGYVAGTYLHEVGLLTGDVVAASVEEANIRVQPSVTAASLGKMTASTYGSVIGGPISAEGYDWYLLLLDDKRSGWVAGSLLQLAGSAPASGAEESADPVDRPVNSGSVAFRSGAWVRVSEPPINLRSQPDPTSPAIEAIDAGDLLVILSGPENSGGYTWYLVDLDGVQGYAAGEYLTGGFIPGESIQAINASVYLRAVPGVDADIVTSLAVGQTATVVSPDPLLDGEFHWILVRTETGETGYVATEFIEPAE
ncbi:MAG: SH3 domain-containing protein [Thermomicrobiales bacterium]|nr:SH3 domain-containing protein [Thermomicrobiales bacterium]